MKRLRLFGMRSDREEILKVLQHVGCVEIDEPEMPDDPAWESLSRPDDRALNEARDASAAALTALEILKKYAPVKSPLLKSRPVVSEREFFDDGAYAAALETARTLVDAEQRITALHVEQGRLRTQRLALAPWLSLDVPLDTASTQDVVILSLIHISPGPFTRTGRRSFRLSPEGARTRHRLKRRCVWKGSPASACPSLV